ncbi:MAG: C40 family peptidase [Jatrophihabitans sp.]
MHSSVLRRLPALLAGATALAAAAVLVTPGVASAANPPGPHDALGKVTSVVASATGLTVSGYAYDPDSTGNVTVRAILDGRVQLAQTATSVANPNVRARYHTGSTPGFSFAVPTPSGNHTLCIVAFSIGPGLSTLLNCYALPYGTALTSGQQATHSPRGSIATTMAAPGSLTVTGWADDPDFFPRRSVVVVYVDSVSAATITTHAYPAPRPAGAAINSAFATTIPVSTGTHVACVWVVNVGFGSNTFLGCRTADTRGPAGTGTVTQPALNKQVVTEALKHIGQPYVWGATGPKSFDCSGLVTYSYGRFGYSTPRTSEQQFLAARSIPASRAVPGDLVFYFDNSGDVYHVGIYLSPGRTVAAIDEQEGVNYQTIWDPTSTAYGSFTHS